jgi:hypothetical protein
LVKRNVERGGKGEEKPAGNEIVDRLNEHQHFLDRWITVFTNYADGHLPPLSD